MQRRTIALFAALLTGCFWKRLQNATEIAVDGEQLDLRKRAAGARPNAPVTPPVLVLALDGVSRPLLYDMLRAGKLPKLAALLGSSTDTAT